MHPHTVHRRSTVAQQWVRERVVRQRPKRAGNLDVVVAVGRIPQHIVVGGLDSDRADGVNWFGWPGPRGDSTSAGKTTERGSTRRRRAIDGGASPGHSQLSSGPLDQYLEPVATQIADVTQPELDGRTGSRTLDRTSGGKAGGRLEFSRPDVAKALDDHPLEQQSVFRGVRFNERTIS